LVPRLDVLEAVAVYPPTVVLPAPQRVYPGIEVGGEDHAGADGDDQRGVKNHCLAAGKSEQKRQ
jgi:hypothetical protein